MSLKRVKADEATTEQILDFLTAAGVEIEPGKSADRDYLETLVEAGKYHGGMIFVSDVTADPYAGQGRMDLSEEGWDPKKERWVRCHFLPDHQVKGEGKSTPIFVCVNGEFLHVPRGRPVVLRERFARHIMNCIEIRREQSIPEDGKQVSRFEDALVLEEPRYPGSLLGFHGYVANGSPDREKLKQRGIFLIDREGQRQNVH